MKPKFKVGNLLRRISSIDNKMPKHLLIIGVTMELNSIVGTYRFVFGEECSSGTIYYIDRIYEKIS